MQYRLLRYIFALTLYLLVQNAVAQPCADTQPVISGSQAVTNSQMGVIYSTPSIPGHTYSWSVTGGTITSGMNTNQITVTWGGIGAGQVQLTETNPAVNCSTTVVKNVLVQPLLVAYLYYTNESCYGNTLQFFSTPSIAEAGNPITAWFWDFGDGTTSTLQNPTHTYSIPYNVTWTVTLIVTNQTGYKDTIYDAVYVNPDQYIPHADYLTNIPNCAYDAVSFDGSISTTPFGTNGIINYKWEFGDPASGASNIVQGTSPLATHVFTAPNTYDVKLTITNGKYCIGTITKQVTIQQSVPASNFSFSTPTCINNPTFFTDLSTFPAGHGITTWEWRFGDGATPVIINAPASPDVSHTYSSLGPFPVMLIVTNDLGCRDTIMKPVSLTPSPIALFTNSSNCFGDAVQFNSTSLLNNGPAIQSYEWNFDDPGSGFNTSNNANPTHTFSTTGDFDVSLVIVNQAGCPDTLIRTITIFPIPAVEYTWNLGAQNNLVQFHLDQSITPIGMIGNMVQWNFGDGSFGVGYDPTHIYPAGGLFNVTLTVTDTIGCSNSVTHQIYVPSLPMAFFSTNSPVCLGQPICVTDLSNTPTPPFGWIETWIWNWGDGSPNDTIHFPNTPHMCHYYSIADTFAITLTVYDNNGYSDDFTREVIILPNPKANFYFTDGCANQTIQFTDASSPNGGGNVISYDWNFDDPLSGINNISNLQNPIHTFGLGGTYHVRLIIENFNGCKDTIYKDVPVRFAPPVDFTNDTACLNDVITFNGNTGVTQIDSIATWSWNFGDGTPLSTDPVTTAHLYTAPGTYDVTLIVTDKHGCMNFVTHTVKVNPLPIAQFSWSAPACESTEVQFLNQSIVPSGFTGYIAKWKWEFGDGSPAQIITIPNNPNVTHVFPTTSTTYTVRLTVWSSDSCTQFIEKIVTLIPQPTALFSYTTNNNCSNLPVLFTDQSQTNGGGSVVTWSWNFDDPGSGINNISTIPNPQHTFLNSGTYNVQLIVFNASGCSDTIFHQLTIAAPPQVNFTADTACFNTPTQFTFSYTNPSIISYLWEFGDGNTSSLPNPTHTYLTYGIFTVKLTVTTSAGCVNDTTRQILVNPNPTAAFSFTSPNCLGAPVAYTDMSSTVPGYLGQIKRWIWDFGDGVTVNILYPNNPNVTHTFVGAALNHTVTLTIKTGDSCTHSVSHVVTSVASPAANFSYPTSNCAEQSVQFTDLSGPNGGGNIVSWNWDFGDPSSGGNNFSSAQNPIHFFSAAGNYTVKLVVFNSSNCSDTITYPVAIIAKPTVNFTADTACLNHVTTFTDASPTGQNLTQWFWEFGDGFTSTIQNPTHQYASAGVYSVRLKATTAEGCFNEKVKNILVIGEPVAAFSTSAPSCASDSVHFTDQSTTPHGSIHQWDWDFGDGNTITRTWPASPNVAHKYATAGSYNVKLKITTTDQCEKEIIIPVLIQAAPLANFTNGTPLCEDMLVQFTDLTQTNGGAILTQWAWDFDDPGSGSANTSNLQNPLHAFSAPGTYTVRLTVTNGTGCTSKDSADVTVGAAPVAIFSADTACMGSPTQFTDASTTPAGTITAWSWTFGDPASGTNNTSSLQNPTHIFTAPGSYTVTLTVTNSGTCEQDTSMVINVNPKPSALFEASTSCVSSETQFTDLSIAPGSSIVSWFWDFGDGTGTSTIQNPVYVYAASGTYNVKLVVTNLSNCQDSVTVPVIVRPTPIAAMNYTTYFCPSGQVDFQDMSQGQGSAIVDRLWIFEPGQMSNLPNPTYVFSVPGTNYPVTLIAIDNYGCRDTIVDTIPVKPGFAFTFNHDTVCFGNQTHFTPENLAPGDTLYSLLWEFGDPASGPLNFSHDYNAVHVFTAPGQYYVKLRATDSDNCADSVFKTITVNALPLAQYQSSSVPCDSVIHFMDVSTAGSGTVSSWEWVFGDGSPSIIIPAPGPGDTSHIYSALGTYPVTLKITNTNGCIDTITQTVERYPCIMADFLASDTGLCSRYPIMFVDSSLPVNLIQQWYWSFGDGKDTTYTSYTGNLIHEYQNAGTYTVKLKIQATVSMVTFHDSLMQTITIHPTPLPGFKNNDACLKMPNMFFDTSLSYGAPITTWTWYFSDPGSGPADTSHQKNPVHNYDSAYIYPVQLIVTNQYGCSDTLVKNTRVLQIPEAKFINSLACEANPTFFTDNTSQGDTTIGMWHWNFGDVNTKLDTSLLRDPFYRYPKSGDYTVRLIVKDMNGCYDTVDSLVNVLVSPVSSFQITDNVNGMTGKVKFNNQSSGADVFYWDFGNGQTSVEESPIATFEEDGTYLVTLISKNQNECMDTSYFKYTVLFKGLYMPNAFAPTSTNPAVMLFQPVGVNIKIFNLEVYDSWGNLIWSSDTRDLDLMGRPTKGWNGTDSKGELMPPGTYMWKANATFIDGTEWQGSDIGKGEISTKGTVTLIR